MSVEISTFRVLTLLILIMPKTLCKIIYLSWIGLLLFYYNISLAQFNETPISYDFISQEEGLSDETVTCFLQDSRGFMWIGTKNGLNKYDAYNFTVYRKNAQKPQSISGNHIISLFEDNQGFIWIGTAKNGLNRYDRRFDTFETFPYEKGINSALEENTVLAILQDKQGVFYIGTRNGLSKFNLRKRTFELIKITVIDPLFSDAVTVNTLMEDSRQQLWIGTDKGLIRWSRARDKMTPFLYNKAEKNSLNSDTIRCLFEAKDSTIWIGTAKGVNTFDLSSETFEKFHFNHEEGLEDEEHEEIDEADIRDIVADKKGNIWIGTFGHGLVKVNNKLGEVAIYTNIAGNQQSLRNDSISQLYVDKSGLLWISTKGEGISLANLTQIHFNRLYKEANAVNTLLSDTIRAVMDDGESIWMGTPKGLSIYHKLTQTFYNLKYDSTNPLSISDAAINDIYKDKSGNIWIGTDKGGLNKWIQGEYKTPEDYAFERYTIETVGTGLASNRIYCLEETKDSLLWIGTDRGLSVLNRNRSTFSVFTHKLDNESSINGDSIRCLYKNPSGQMMIGTHKGWNVWREKTSDFERFELPSDSLKSKAVQAIFQEKNGLLWLGTAKNGIYVLNGERNVVETYTEINGLKSNHIQSLEADEDGNVWASTSKGLSRISGSGEGINKQSQITNFHAKNWLPTNTFNRGAYFQSKDHVLYYGTDKGLIYFHADDVKGNTFVPPVIITRFELFFENVPIQIEEQKPIMILLPDSISMSSPLRQHITETRSLILNHDQNVLFFEFAALSFVNSQANKYEYKMENFDNFWRTAKGNRSATYTNLDPGKYVFRVRAANNDGIWNEEGTSISIKIESPFTQKIEFYLLLILVGIGLIVLFVKLWTRNLENNRRVLQQKVKERTQELEEQKNEILQQALQLKEAKEVISSQKDKVESAYGELNQTHEELKSAQTKLVEAEKMASLGQLTAGIAHEINNPINFVSGNIQPLKKDVEDLMELLREYDEMVKKHDLKGEFESVEALKEHIDFDFLKQEITDLLAGIEEGAQRTTEIVNGLRSFSRLDEDEKKWADLNESLDNTLLILKSRLADSDIEVIKQYGKVPRVMCFPAKLNQVFLNLLTNAIQSIEEEESHDEHEHILIQTYETDTHVFVRIKDTGKGMSEEVKKRIFEPFFTTKDVGQGTGLGMSISFGIIEQHKGKIEVESEERKGTTMTIALPKQ